MPLILDRRLILFVGLTAFFAGAALAQDNAPWTVVIKPNANPLMVAECSPVRIDLTDATSKAAPRNPKGQLVSLADFDMSVAAGRDGVIVGRYDGASQWSACACPGAAGATATITRRIPRDRSPRRRASQAWRSSRPSPSP